MELIGKTIKIIVKEPCELEGDIFGIVMSDLRGKLLVKLVKPIKGHTLTCDLIELKLTEEQETIEKLSKHYSVSVGGALIKEKYRELDYIIIGRLKLY